MPATGSREYMTVDHNFVLKLHKQTPFEAQQNRQAMILPGYFTLNSFLAFRFGQNEAEPSFMLCSDTLAMINHPIIGKLACSNRGNTT